MYFCSDCPKNCNAKRDGKHGKGFCGEGELLAVAKIMVHYWEEPVISGTKGCTNIFFRGCNLKCIYCQNSRINGTEEFSDEATQFYNPEDFGKLLIEISNTQESHCIGLVTGDHFIRQIATAITPEVKAQIKKPIVFNCGGYIKTETLELLKDKIDIFLPDFKYFDNNLAIKYSHSPDYKELCLSAVKKMYEFTGPAIIDNGLMKSGVCIRHLILPGALRNTIDVIDLINDEFKNKEIIFGLMSQYTPMDNPKLPDCLKRRITGYEKWKAEAFLDNADNIFACFTQQEESSDKKFIPDF